MILLFANSANLSDFSRAKRVIVSIMNLLNKLNIAVYKITISD